MQALPESPLLTHNSDTLEAVRKEFDLHQPGRIEESVDRFSEWIAAQPHFNKKDYRREYLESLIINSKGSVEVAKGLLEKLCAYKTFASIYFTYRKPIDMKGLIDDIHFVYLPKLTKENHRILCMRDTVHNNYTVHDILNYVIKNNIMYEYYLKYNYSLGMRIIIDYRKADLYHIISAVKYPEGRNAFGPFFKGYAPRIKSVHVVCSSKVMVDLLVACVSQIISLKMFGRVYVHTDIEELYEHVDKDLLPSDFGGKERTLAELKDDWDKELSTDMFMEHVKEMYQATIDPSLKPVEKFNDLFLGIPGTFRTLSID